MRFTEAVRTVLKQKYATFSGRASRSEYWWFGLFYVLALFPLAILATVLAFLTSGGGAPSPAHYTVAIWMLFTLAMLLPLISLQVRRFHDRNISGWWYLALFALAFIPYAIFHDRNISGWYLALFALSFIPNAMLLTAPVTIVISLLPGTKGPNKFGPDPLSPEARAEVFA
ncbi:DUF805 domain-containing protein [Rhizobium etli]|uniref:Uncharacterized membrane protein YhaH (DUF805 family) n=1 Tax=Rhizobium etli TaxID=29449 RepID=A0A7W7EGL5_RHIET|nr:DUF805 domain-containing protein [Rhizobium etli]MBB4482494.1 uncharacterized membrane protein YhaH (DUF805 family) [Rhizobium etli]MBB4538323.1 uncharacterized membrane protein YhaH (DUF805 family) [Rhizobium etli]